MVCYQLGKMTKEPTKAVYTDIVRWKNLVKQILQKKLTRQLSGVYYCFYFKVFEGQIGV